MVCCVSSGEADCLVKSIISTPAFTVSATEYEKEEEEEEEDTHERFSFSFFFFSPCIVF